MRSIVCAPVKMLTWCVFFYSFLTTIIAKSHNDVNTDIYDEKITLKRSGYHEPYIYTSDALNSLRIGQVLSLNEELFDDSLNNILDHTEVGYSLFDVDILNASITRQNQASRIMTKGIKILQKRYEKTEYIKSDVFMKMLKKDKLIVHGICKVDNSDCSKLSPEQLEYRSIDGRCNNLKHAYWGQSNKIYIRYQEPNYEDGLSKPKLSVTGDCLPSARKLSTGLFFPEGDTHEILNVHAAMFGQPLTHDIEFQQTDVNKKGPIQCCGPKGTSTLPLDRSHRSCFPIRVPESDYWYSQFNITCLNFVRSIPVPRPNCQLGPIEQLNLITNYVDASLLYGNDEDTLKSLRAFQDGLMLNSYKYNQEYMLLHANNKVCDVKSDDEPCYRTGDPRVNQNIALVGYHTLLLRLHNKIAREFKKLNPQWEEEKLFQQTRKLVIGIWQHISFWEWLPVFLGSGFFKLLFGNMDADGYTSLYNETVQAGILNEFSIGLRAFHSAIPANLWMQDEDRNLIKSVLMSEQLLRPIEFNADKSNFDNILRGLASQPMPKIDEYLTAQITNMLFKSSNIAGTDLGAIDIQRSRDHGVPMYNKFREICGFEKIEHNYQLYDKFGKEKADRLLNHYNHVDDIELIVGGLYEPHLPGTEFGEVFNHLIADQFYRLVVSDRYFYTNKVQNAYKFTPAQLKEIKKTSLAFLICECSDNVQNIQKRAFKMQSEKNPLLSCKDIPTIDLSLWKY